MFFFPITAQVVSDINLDNCVFQISSNLHEKILKKKRRPPIKILYPLW